MEEQITTVAAPGSSAWPEHTGVSRTELNPVSFLYRSVAVHPERVAVVHRDRRYTYRRARRAREPARIGAPRPRAGAPRPRCRAVSRTCRPCSSCTTACPPRAACSSRSIPD